ncbi:MAG: zinc ribbon domain-containing protein, partial [Eubacteriales bacterium]|nr:zinc ribbon domain-containing protein [Eubacteriales bacterium]
MLEKWVDKVRLYGDSMKADRTNKSEKDVLNQQKKQLNTQLTEAYCRLGADFYAQNLTEIPEEFKEYFNRIAEIYQQLEECDVQIQQSDQALVERKKEIDDEMQEREERRRTERELKRQQKEQERQQKELEKEQERQQKAQELQEAQEAAAFAEANNVFYDEGSGKKCPECGAVLSEDALFCFNCGARVEEPQKTESYISNGEANKKCSNCGNVLVDDALFCNFCGTKVEA